MPDAHIPHTGMTRAAMRRDHAVIPPDTHVPINLPGWSDIAAHVLIAPEMGAKFTQIDATCEPGANARPYAMGDEWFLLTIAGSLTLEIDGSIYTLNVDDYAYLPPDTGWRLASAGGARFLAFTKPYIPHKDAHTDSDSSPPPALFRSLGDVPAEPFLGDPGALLQVLLPDDLAFDWGINLFDFAPGGTLPQVESHFMEHGLFLLAGQGVYRLGDHWYPVEAGDAIWMGPYVPQWYVAAGKSHSRYLYYKEMNRTPGA